MNERDLFPGAAQAAQYGERQESVQSPPIIEQTPAEPESKPNETQLRWSPPETVAKHGGVEPIAPSAPTAPRADSVNMDDVVADLSGGWLPTRQERAATVPVRATRGFRGALARMGLPIGPGAAERAERERLVLIEDAERQIRQARWPRAAVGVLVANRKGGAGKTPTAVCLGGALASIRGGGVAIQEVADDPGTIAGRAEGSPLRGIGELMQEVGAIRSKGELESYTQPQTSHAHVIGSPRRRPGLTGEDVRSIAQVIDEYYSIRLMDSGNQMTSSAFIEAVRLADALVIPNPNAGDSTTDMVALFNELRAMSEHGRRLASTATILRIHDGRPEDPAVVERIDNIIEQLRAEYPNVAVVDVPYDEHLAGRGEITLASLARPTYEAFALAGASVVRAIHQSDRH